MDFKPESNLMVFMYLKYPSGCCMEDDFMGHPGSREASCEAAAVVWETMVAGGSRGTGVKEQVQEDMVCV